MCVCVCVCVFGIHVLKIAVERCFWEVHMVFQSLVVLHVWLHSCIYFSLLEKLFLKACSTPSRHLAICRASKLVFLITISTPPRHLVDRSRSSCLLDSFSIARSIDWASMLDMVGCSSTPSFVDGHFLDTFLDSLLNTSRHLHLSRFTDGLFNLLVRSATHFCRSLSRYICLFNSKISLTHSNLLPQVSSRFFKIFFT